MATVKVACPKIKGNDKGFYICDEDKVPKGATIYKEVKGK